MMQLEHVFWGYSFDPVAKRLLLLLMDLCFLVGCQTLDRTVS